MAGANVLSATLLLGGIASGHKRLTHSGLTLLEGNLILGVALDLTKTAFGRARPSEPHHGQFFQGGESFPSSHAAHAFLIASVLDATIHRPWGRWTFYPLAGLVALSRLQKGVHYPTDVVVGAFLGWWVGSRLCIAHGLKEKNKIMPSIILTPQQNRLIFTLAW